MSIQMNNPKNIRDMMIYVRDVCNKHDKVLPILQFNGTPLVNGEYTSITIEENKIECSSTDQFFNQHLLEHIKNIVLKKGYKTVSLFGILVTNASTTHFIHYPSKEFKELLMVPSYNIFDATMIGVQTITLDFNDPRQGLTNIQHVTEAVCKECPWNEICFFDTHCSGVLWSWKNDPYEDNLWFITTNNSEDYQNLMLE